MEKKKILIVEDDFGLRGLLIDGLQEDFKIFQAEDGEVGIKLALEQKPHLILLDILLPKVDGYEVLETIRKHKDPEIANIPVIVLSNLWSDKDILRIKALRISEYFVKSNTPLPTVFEKVKKFLRDI